MEIFSKQATVGDAIGWIVTIPMMLSSFTIGPMIPGIVGNFHHMFDALHGELPMITQLVLGIPTWCLPFPLMALALGSAWIMCRSGDNTNKALIPMAFLGSWAAYVGLLIGAIFYPILLLQAAVRGG